MGIRKPNSEENPFETSSEAKGELKYRVGLSKDQKPVFIHKTTVYVGGEPKEIEQEFYEVDLGPEIGRVHLVLMQHEANEHHAHPHWEVALPKTDALGQMVLGSMGERAGSFEYHSANKVQIFFKAK